MKNQHKLILAALCLSFAGASGFKLYPRKPQALINTSAQKTNDNRITLSDSAGQLPFLVLSNPVQTLMPVSETLNARLQLSEDLTARVFPAIAGRIVKLRAQVGDAVSAGTPLAELDSPEWSAAMADLHKAESAQLLKSRAYARAKLLYEAEALPLREQEAAQDELNFSNAELQRCRSRVKNLTAAFPMQGESTLMLRAPLGGIVVERQANPGTETRPDSAQPLFTISDLKTLWLTIDLPEKAVDLVQTGAPVLFRVDAYPDTEFMASVDKISASVDPVTRRIAVRATVANTDMKLKPEMYARANLGQSKTKQVLRLPVGAVLTSGLTTTLFVQITANTFENRKVTVLRQDSEFVYLDPNSPVKAEDQVVVRGALLLASEMAIGE